MNVIGSFNGFLEKLGVEKRFYCIDSVMGDIIFFCTREWAEEFERRTDCHMITSHTM